jgi:hypothetical protein
MTAPVPARATGRRRDTVRARDRCAFHGHEFLGDDFVDKMVRSEDYFRTPRTKTGRRGTAATLPAGNASSTSQPASVECSVFRME